MNDGRFTRALVRAPGPGFERGLTTAGLGAPDLARAREQHARYAAALRAAGLELDELAPEPDFPDATFVEDVAVLFPGVAVLTRPGAPSRAGEVRALEPALRARFRDVRALAAPATLDGGDVCLAPGHLFIGLSQRTNAAGAEQLSAIARALGLGTSVIDVRAVPGLLHLKSGLAWVDGRTLVTAPALAGHPGLAGWEELRVTRAEEYGANCVRVNERVLVPAGHPGLERALRARGLAPLALDVGEFRKMDGGLSCLSLRF